MKAIFWVFLLYGLSPVMAYGDTSLSSIPDPNTILSQSAGNAIVRTVGIVMDNRDYEPATPLGMSGFNFGLEVTLVQPPSNLGSQLSGIANATSGSTSGSSSSATAIPVLPSLRLHFHKGLGDRVDIGTSLLPPISSIPIVGGSFFFGVSLKVVVFKPAEGPVWSIRGSYNYNNLTASYDGAQLTVKTVTYTPQLVVSQKLDFADPYVGLAYQVTQGSVSATIPIPAQDGLTVAPVSLTQTGSGVNAYVFGGVQMTVPQLGLQITLEGAYSPYGMNALGVKVGFAF